MTEFKKLPVVDARETVDFPLDFISGGIVLQVLPATEANKKWFNESLKVNRSPLKRAARNQLSAEMLEDQREKDYELYAKHVVKGWNNKVVDVDGDSVPFSPTDCLDFLRSLGDTIFDEVRAFCGNPYNFMDLGGDEEELVKNS